jgi:hypothetical protein
MRAMSLSICLLGLLVVVFIQAQGAPLRSLGPSGRSLAGSSGSLAVPGPLKIRLTQAVILDSQTCILPFTRVGNLILIQAQADTTTGLFVLDTGTPNLVLNLTYFRRYPTSNPIESGGVTGAISTSAQTRVDSLTLGAMHYYHQDADLVNLGQIENRKGVKIFGLLGMKLFEHCELIIDYDRNLVFLHQMNRKEAMSYQSEWLTDSAAYRTIPIDLEQDKIIAHLLLKGKKLKFVVDSGAESSVLDSRLPNKVFENVTITRRVHLNGAGAQEVDVLYGEVKGLQMGDLLIASLPVLITSLQSMCDAYGNCIDGMLGTDYLSQHKIGFNFVTRKMFLWK